MRHDPDLPQQPDRAARKSLRRREGPREWQLQHKIGAAAHRGLRAGKLGIDRRLPPLDKIAGHDAHHAALFSEPRARIFQMQAVSIVKRVIFRHNSNDILHFCPFFHKKRLPFMGNVLK